MKKLSIIISIFALLFISAPTASAATAVVTVSQTTDLAAEGQTVSVNVANFPRKAGIYLMQCVESTPNTRPTICNQAAQLWISFIPGASFVPTAPITMKLDSKFASTDCAIEKCGVFVRYDHTASSDLSEDQFIPLTFVSKAQNISQVATSLKLGKSVKLPKMTDAGTQIKYKVTSKSKKICRVRNNAVNGFKAGNCIVKATAPATVNKDAFTSSLLIKIKR